MAKDAKRLLTAFQTKEQIEEFLGNLEKLKAEKSIDESQYGAMKEEYQRRFTAATSDITAGKNDLKGQLERSEHHLETCRFELDRLSVRFKVGELPMEKFQRSEQKLRTAMGKTENSITGLKMLIDATSSAEIHTVRAKPETAISGSAPPREFTIGGGISEKSRLVVVLLAFPLGQFGAHRFYAGKMGTAITMLVLAILGWSTIWYFGGGFVFLIPVWIWTLVDFVFAVAGRFTDDEGNLIEDW